MLWCVCEAVMLRGSVGSYATHGRRHNLNLVRTWPPTSFQSSFCECDPGHRQTRQTSSNDIKNAHKEALHVRHFESDEVAALISCQRLPNLLTRAVRNGMNKATSQHTVAEERPARAWVLQASLRTLVSRTVFAALFSEKISGTRMWLRCYHVGSAFHLFYTVDQAFPAVVCQAGVH